MGLFSKIKEKYSNTKQKTMETYDKINETKNTLNKINEDYKTIKNLYKGLTSENNIVEETKIEEDDKYSFSNNEVIDVEFKEVK